MRKRSLFISAILLLIFLAGCGKAKYVITSSSAKTTIEVKNVEDGTYAETSAISISGKKTVYIESQLDHGELKIEFGEAVNTASSDEPEDYTVVNIVETVNVTPGDKLEIHLDSAEYILQLTAVGNTDGKVIIEVK